MIEALGYPFFQRALVAAILAGIAAGIVGSVIVVRRIASLSGSLAHAAFGGLGLAHFLGTDPMFGAAGFGVAAGIGVGAAFVRGKGGIDNLIAMVWAVGMALGILFIAVTPGYAPRLESYLFGSLLLVPADYLVVVAVLDAVVLGLVLLFFQPLRAVLFDDEHSRIAGLGVGPILVAILAFTSLTIVVLIRVVGVVLVIALLTIPPAIARHWSRGLAQMMALAAAVATACSVLGLFLSYGLSAVAALSVPTGPLIIVIAAAAYGLSAALLRFRRGRRPGSGPSR